MVTYIFALFGAGIASFLAPCVVPLVPAYLGMIAGEVPKKVEGEKVKTPVIPTLLFILGFSLVFASLGAVAGAFGFALDDVKEFVKIAGGIILVIMGLVLLGMFRSIFGREKRLLPTVPHFDGKLENFRPVILGVAFGAAWSPCVGPLLGAALSVSATSGHVLTGTIYLFAYAMGIGVPFLVVSLLLASYPQLIGKLARLSHKIEKITAVLLIILGILLLTGEYETFASYLAELTPGSLSR
ncbi:MAG TPA: cytochrome c biogenesis protein CcdA [Acidimicrobiia bacterium]|nr:cytochrome c biogenesis protein CcdA [Acidimicrobiia bacterium]